jgi:hypothetical protein
MGKVCQIKSGSCRPSTASLSMLGSWLRDARCFRRSVADCDRMHLVGRQSLGDCAHMLVDVIPARDPSKRQLALYEAAAAERSRVRHRR